MTLVNVTGPRVAYDELISSQCPSKGGGQGGWLGDKTQDFETRDISESLVLCSDCCYFNQCCFCLSIYFLCQYIVCA